MERKRIDTDVLVIGGGTAGCYAALTIGRNSDLSVLIAEKANIRRSGCLAAGVNAINAYITKGKQPQDYVDYATKDAAGIVRQDLLLTAAEKFNEVTADMEKLGLVILKDANGEYVTRGDRNIKINGENFKPLLAAAVKENENITVLNHVNITDLLVAENKVYGAVGFSVIDKEAVEIRANAVLVTTGGAAGLYRPNNPGFSRHKMWYPPFNTGAGYAMGLKAGAEMTTFEMRFIALRCKDTIAPTGTIAQGVKASQVNSKGVVYEQQYGLSTSERVYGTVRENQLGNGPCYLRTSTMEKEKDDDLLKAYLNMAPSQTLKWVESGKKPSEADVEIEGTEPYIVGGHTASGYWVNTNRETTIHGLYAAGDVAGGCPQKYVTGALAEGEIAALDILSRYASKRENYGEDIGHENILKEDISKKDTLKINILKEGSQRENLPKTTEQPVEQQLEMQAQTVIRSYERILRENNSIETPPLYTIEELEEAMQKVMDEYAGGISTHYQFNEKQLALAEEKITMLQTLAEQVEAADMHELLFAYELQERLIVCRAVIAHLLARKETRWHSFNENLDYPSQDEQFMKYVNSRMEDGKIQIRFRELVKEARYEHTD